MRFVLALGCAERCSCLSTTLAAASAFYQLVTSTYG